MQSHIKLNEIEIRKHLREAKKTDPDSAAEELCSLLNQHLNFLKHSIHRNPFFPESPDRLKDAKLIRCFLDEINKCQEGSPLQKLFVAINSEEFVKLFRSESIVASILKQFFSFFPEYEYIHRLPFALCECIFPEKFKSKRVDEPKVLSETVIDEKHIGEKKLTPVKSHLQSSAVEDYKFDKLLEKLEEAPVYDSSDDEMTSEERDHPINNVARKLIISCELERQKMAEKLVAMIVKRLLDSLKGKPDKEEFDRNSYTFKMPSFIWDGIGAFLMAGQSVEFAPKAYDKLLEGIIDVAKRKPLNANLIACVCDFVDSLFKVGKCQNKKVLSEFAVQIMGFLAKGFPPETSLELKRLYLDLLRFTVFALDKDGLDQAEFFLNMYLPAVSEAKSTAASVGLATIVVLVNQQAESTKEDHARRERILAMFANGLDEGFTFKFHEPFKLFAPCLTAQEVRLFAEKFRVMPDLNQKPHLLLENILDISLEKRRKQHLISEQIIKDTEELRMSLPSPICRLIGSYAG